MDEQFNDNHLDHDKDLPELLPAHRESLCKESGISDDVLRAARVFSGDETTSKKYVGYSQSGIIFSYHNLKSETIGARIRLDAAAKCEDGKSLRYLQPKDTHLNCYIIPSTIPDLLDVTKPLIIVEGEKKALSVASYLKPTEGVPVGIPGCWNWKKSGEKSLGEIWDEIPLKGRTILWTPDTDFFTNPSVTAAGEQFVYHLTQAGATVYLIDLRIEGLSAKIGADDFLVQAGEFEFRQRCKCPIWSFSACPEDIERVEPTARSVEEFLRARVCIPKGEIDPILEALRKKTGFKIDSIRAINKEARKQWMTTKGAPRRSERTRIIAVSDSRLRRPVLLEIVWVLKDDGRFYAYGKELLRIGKDKDIVSADALPAKLSDLGVEFLKETDKGDKYLLLPLNLAKALFHSDTLRHELNEILLFADHPIYDSQWELAKPGYNARDKIFYNGNAIEPVKTIQILKEVFGEFLFKNEASKCNFIAALLTAILRNKYMGDRPFCALTGNRPNIGKTLACKVLSRIAEGLPPETLTYTPNQEELEKQLASRADKRDVVLIDNVRSQQPIASAVMERMVTDVQISFRRLGQTTTITRPNTIVLMVTMNRAQFNQDLITRALPIEFYLEDSKDPTEHKFTHESLEQYVLKNRVAILQELCGMVENWKEEGRPLCKKDFRFRTWTREIGGILEANGFTAFLDNLESATAEYDQISHEIGKLFEESVGRPLTADELVKACSELNLFSEIRAQSRQAATALSNLLAKHCGKKIPLPDSSLVVLKEGFHPSKKVKTFTATPLASDKAPDTSPGTPDTSLAPETTAEGGGSPSGTQGSTPSPTDPRGSGPISGVPGADDQGNDLEW